MNVLMGSHYEFPSKHLQLLGKDSIYKHEFQNLAIMLLLNMQTIFLANILVMKKDRDEESWLFGRIS